MPTDKAHLGNPYRAGPAPITAGDPSNRAMGVYGKSAKPLPSIGNGLLSVTIGSLKPIPTTPKKAPPVAVRGLKGGVGPRIKEGGIGPAKLGGYGSARIYDKKPLGEG